MDNPKLQQDLASLLTKHGKNNVLTAIHAITKPRRGRPKVLDWNELSDALEADAIDLINRKNPLAERSNTAIAKRLAKITPLQSFDSSVRRLQSKLAKNRLQYALVFAAVMSCHMAAHKRHFEIVKDLIDSEKTPFWTDWQSENLRVLASYTEAFGSPSETATMAEIIAQVASVKRANSAGYGLGLSQSDSSRDKKRQF
jgi:hypothetical protein